MNLFRTILTLLCLLAFATSASAECAWVVWKRTIITGENIPVQSDTITPLVASTSQADCEAVAKKLREEKSGEREEVIHYSGGAEPVRARELYWCLPDTVDPRGPKGK